MATFTVTAFKWSGTGYNAKYTNSHTATFDDNDTAYEGSGDSDETVSIDGGAPSGTWGQPYSIDVNFKDTGGQEHVETFHFFKADGDWYFVPKEESEFTEGAHLGIYQSHSVGWDYASVVCFADGTLIDSATGPRPVETLMPGDRICTFGGQSEPLRLNLTRAVGALEMRANDRLRPVAIEAGALGMGLPKKRLCVSRQHRMLVRSPIGKRMFGPRDVLIPAIRLTDLPGCYVDVPDRPVIYHHLVFDRHVVLFANGAPSESFFPGAEAIRALPKSQQEDVFRVFPDLRNRDDSVIPARYIPRANRQRRLIARHNKNQTPILSEV